MPEWQSSVLCSPSCALPPECQFDGIQTDSAIEEIAIIGWNSSIDLCGAAEKCTAYAYGVIQKLIRAEIFRQALGPAGLGVSSHQVIRVLND